jgi:hypothetical protein
VFGGQLQDFLRTLLALVTLLLVAAWDVLKSQACGNCHHTAPRWCVHLSLYACVCSVVSSATCPAPASNLGTQATQHCHAWRRPTHHNVMHCHVGCVITSHQHCDGWMLPLATAQC